MAIRCAVDPLAKILSSNSHTDGGNHKNSTEDEERRGERKEQSRREEKTKEQTKKEKEKETKYLPPSATNSPSSASLSALLMHDVLAIGPCLHLRFRSSAFRSPSRSFSARIG